MNRYLALLGALFLFTSLSVAPAASAPGPGCVAAAPGAAATALLGPEVSVSGAGLVGGLDVAVATDPLITPGFDVALLRDGDRWCRAEAFNHVADLARQPADLAADFASVAAMPYLGEVTASVREARRFAGGMEVSLRTVGGRHSAISEWTVVVDARGVRRASFTTVALGGRGPATISTLEGLTSLPGHRRWFNRGADGLVRIDATPADLLARSLAERDAGVANAAAMVGARSRGIAGTGPGDELSHTFADGQTVKISYGSSPFTPDPGTDAVETAARLRSLHDGLADQYEAFLRAGMADPFDNTTRTIQGTGTVVPDEAGYVNVDSAFGLSCFACAVFTDGIEVHMTSLFPEVMEEFAGIVYPDPRQFMVAAMGHEIFHSFQHGYSNTDGIPSGQFLEGLARASEAIHDNAHNNFHPGGVSYADDTNGCDGFDNGHDSWIDAQADGPFQSFLYESCYFYWTYLAAHGPGGLTQLLEALPAAQPMTGDPIADMRRLLDLASPTGDGAKDLATWAAAAAAGSGADGFTLTAGLTGEPIDWFALLDQSPRSQELGSSQAIELAPTGAMAFDVTTAGRIAAAPTGAALLAYRVTGGSLSSRPVAVGHAVAPGEILVVVAPGLEAVAGELVLAAG